MDELRREITDAVTGPRQQRGFQFTLQRSVDRFLICDGCKHNTISYDPAKDGGCEYGCH